MIRGAVLQGIEALLVEVQIGIGTGVGFRIVGLGKTEVKESEVRLRLALEASGFVWPQGAITINLAPADVPKTGTHLDLPLALAILVASGQVKPVFEGRNIYAIGELALNGELRSIRGALSIGRAVPENSVVIAPSSSQYELGLLRQIKDASVRKQFLPLVVDDLPEAVKALTGKGGTEARVTIESFATYPEERVDFKNVKGQRRAKRALEIAAAGGHNVLLVGPPGEGKSMLAKAVPTILPKLTHREILDLTWIYSAGGRLRAPNEIVVMRPYRPVHHTATAPSIVGGGSGYPSPGEITFAHLGVLFMDEIVEFSPQTLDTLRQPVEDGQITISRVKGSARYPCEFILIAAMNPCPCGYDGEFICSRCKIRVRSSDPTCPVCKTQERDSRCECSPAKAANYKRRLSGPMLDRFDLTVRIDASTPDDWFGEADGEPSTSIKTRVEAARAVQQRRYQGTNIGINARIPGGHVQEYCELHPSAKKALMEVAPKALDLSMRGFDKLLKVARTVADLNQSPGLYSKHIAEAADLCGHDSVGEGMRRYADPCPNCSTPRERADRFCRSCGHNFDGQPSAPSVP